MGISRRSIQTASVSKAPCPTCKRSQNYKVILGFEQISTSENNALANGVTQRFFVLDCQGCNTVFLASERIEVPFDLSNRSAEDSLVSDWKFFPEPKWRELPNWCSAKFRKKHNALYQLLDDTYDAANRGANILCAMGIRTCFDIAGEILGINASLSFAGKIDELRRKGHISPRKKIVLEVLIDAGSAAAHRGWVPNRDDIKTLLDALETFVHHAIILPEGLDTLAQRVPKKENKR